jgi:pSer/pThr/pTyr-binding forkhead associated (FHA) protein
MVQLKILSGTQAGSMTVARRFPFRVGRGAESDLRLEEPGVWDRHLEIAFEPRNGFLAVPRGEALITVNGKPSGAVRLRNGDQIEMGGAVVQFWLGETQQRGFRLREWMVWSTYALVTALELLLIFRLLE